MSVISPELSSIYDASKEQLEWEQKDSKTILLLCAKLDKNQSNKVLPLNLIEYNILANWLHQQEMNPRDLLEISTNELSKINIPNLNSQRIINLLERFSLLDSAIKMWDKMGIWALANSDSRYPKRMKQNLGELSPPILYGKGNIEILNRGGLVITCSRSADQESRDYTKKVVENCVQQEIPIISPGEYGIEEQAINWTLEAGGNAIGVVSNTWAKPNPQQKIAEQQLSLLFYSHLESKFSNSSSNERTKYLYALGDYILVVKADLNGQVWREIVSALAQIKLPKVFVRTNRELLSKGAQPFPAEPWHRSLKEILSIDSSNG